MRAYKITRKRPAWVFVTVSLLSTLGCALTDSQLAEVKKFSTAAEGYPELVSTPIRQYGQLLVTARVYGTTSLDLTQDKDRKTAKDAFDAAKTMRANFAKLASKVKAHLGILDKYGEALIALTSDNMSKDLTKSAENLAEAIDKDIKVANDLRNAGQEEQLNLIGDAVSSAVSTVGGLYLKIRQTELTKTYVSKMQSNIPLITEVIDKDYSLKVCEPQKDLERDIWKAYIERAQAGKYPSYMDTRAAFDGMSDIADAYALCLAIAEKTKAYQKAHSALAGKLKEKHDLPEVIEEVSEFSKAMQAIKADYKAITAIDKK